MFRHRVFDRFAAKRSSFQKGWVADVCRRWLPCFVCLIFVKDRNFALIIEPRFWIFDRFVRVGNKLLHFGSINFHSTIWNEVRIFGIQTSEWPWERRMVQTELVPSCTTVVPYATCKFGITGGQTVEHSSCFWETCKRNKWMRDEMSCEVSAK